MGSSSAEIFITSTTSTSVVLSSASSSTLRSLDVLSSSLIDFFTTDFLNMDSRCGNITFFHQRSSGCQVSRIPCATPSPELLSVTTGGMGQGVTRRTSTPSASSRSTSSTTRYSSSCGGG